MQLRIEVILSQTNAGTAARVATVRRIVEIAGLRDADVDCALRDGVLCGTISSDRVLELALLDGVADFRLATA